MFHIYHVLKSKYVPTRKTLKKRGFVLDDQSFVKLPVGGNQGVFALDCEMVTTSLGQEVARVSIVDTSGGIVYDEYVKPAGQVYDYNTAYSGITAASLRGVTNTLQDVQMFMKSRFSSETILIGHDLKNDFRALHLIPSAIVDTFLVFPGGLSLKDLTRRHLKYDIQNGPHDSVEDAKACMNIMLKRVK